MRCLVTGATGFIGGRLARRLVAEGHRVVTGTTYLGDTAKARRELGYAPRPLEEGLRETLLHEMGELGLEPPR